MSDRDVLLRAFADTNPLPPTVDLPEDAADARPPLHLLISADVTRRAIEPLSTVAAAGPRRWGAAVRAFALIMVVGVVIAVGAVLTQTGTETPPVDDVVAPSETAPTPNGVSPTLSFDGNQATYSGAQSFDTNEIAFALENTSGIDIMFGWGISNDLTITLEDDISWLETHRGANYAIPDWVRTYGEIGAVASGVGLEVVANIPDGRALVYAWDPQARISYPAAEIFVDSGPPTISFDGVNAHYQGTMTFGSSPITFRVENSSPTKPVFFAAAPEEAVRVPTAEQRAAWEESSRVAGSGSGQGSLGPIVSIEPGATSEVSFALPDGDHTLFLWISEDSSTQVPARISVDTGAAPP